MMEGVWVHPRTATCRRHTIIYAGASTSSVSDNLGCPHIGSFVYMAYAKSGQAKCAKRTKFMRRNGQNLS